MSGFVEFALYAAAIAVALWALYLVFGAQALGLPAMVGVLVVLAVAEALSSAGPLTLLAMVAGLAVLFVVIGMAMSLGAGRPPQAHDEKPKGESAAPTPAAPDEPE